MTIIYSPEETTAILRAMGAVNSANNGYTFLHLAPAVASALVLAGYRIAPAFHPIDG